MVTNFHAGFAQARIDARAELNALPARCAPASPRMSIRTGSLRSLVKSAPALAGAVFMDRAAAVESRGVLKLPVWTNHPPDWWTEVRPTLRPARRIEPRPRGVYRGVEVAAAHSHFTTRTSAGACPMSLSPGLKGASKRTPRQRSNPGSLLPHAQFSGRASFAPGPRRRPATRPGFLHLYPAAGSRGADFGAVLMTWSALASRGMSN